MKKITGKATALVLALALVVTSFSSTFAFAANKTVSGSVDLDTDEIYLVNGYKDSQREVSDAVQFGDLTTTDRSETLSGADVEVASVSHSSGDSLVSWKITDGKVTLRLKDTGKSGKEVLSVLAKGTYTDDNDNKITVKASKTFTVHVLDKDAYVIGKTDAESKAAGKGVDELDSFAQTAGSTQDFSVYNVQAAADSALAKYVSVTSNVHFTDEANYAKLVAKDLQDATVIDITNDTNIHRDGYTLTSGKKSAAVFTDDAATGNVNITATRYDANGKKIDDSKTIFKGKIDKKVDVKALTPHAGDFTITKASKGGSTVLKGVHNTNFSDTNKATAEVVVTGAEVAFPDGTTSVLVEDKSNVKKISGTVGKLSIGEASVGSVDVTGSVTVTDDKASVGDITSAADADSNVASGVEIQTGKVGNIVVKDSGVTISGGTTGTIETKDNAGLITIEPEDEDIAISTQAIKAKAGLRVESNDSAKVSVGDVTVTGNNTEVTLVGNNVNVKSFDFDYYTSKLTLGDSDPFKGTVSAVKNGDNTALSTQEDDTDATISGDVKLDSISVDENTTLTLGGKVNVGDIDGDGTLVVGSNKLYVDGSASGVTFKLNDAQLTNGLTAFTAKSDAVDVDDMNLYGFTVAKSAGNSIDTFKIASLTFAGLQVNKTSAKIAKDYSETFTATAYPTGTAIPAGAKVEWSLDGNEDVFQVTTNGNAATVKVVKIDADFASENTATLSAKLVDADGDEIEDYAPAKVALTALAVPEATSDTTKDFSVAQGSKYTFKITSTTAPSFTLGTAGVFTSALTKQSGNDYFYTITAVGAVGKATGVFLNGNKLLVASVKAPVANFKSDTTTAIKVAAGKSYTYKITSATAPSFGFGTAGVFTVSGVSKTGNDYFYKVTATGKAGAATGVFVNGVKVNVATVG